MLSVNGVLVKGSEGYPVVVGKVKRELARLAEPVAGPDVVIAGRRGGAGRGAGGAGGRGENRLPSSTAAVLSVSRGGGRDGGGVMLLQPPAHSPSQVRELVLLYIRIQALPIPYTYT